MAIGVMPLTSCDKENEPQNEPEQEDQHDPTSDSDQVKVTGYDALSWLQGALVVVNEQGEVVRRVYGKPLDASQPDVISVLLLAISLPRSSSSTGWHPPRRLPG